ncbi:hypothetical protein DM01DRAFT_1336692 [Hesseltinella vesiculosa]|uniref:UBX-domain-containing protein n=1 Tax=Hesseltinella vesiculosa TaxID=101127 RepID=A0A1X2GEY5_9FUNG|nr:hypothetical protein DM01DRAFT_1336692 [Hesseltinella vesiculosa]
MGSDIDTLVGMGFSRGKVQKAWKAVKGAGLQPAMDWLLSHPEVSDDPEEEPQGQSLAASANPTSTETTADADEDEIQPGEQTAQSLRCNECQKLFKDPAAAERHAIRTQHQDFSESTEVIKPLTEEEKQQKLVELKARLAEKRAEQAMISAEEEKVAERLRRKAGRDMSEIRAELEAAEMKKMLAAKKQEKEDDRARRAKIKAQIEQDKLERKAKREAAKREQTGAAVPAPTPVSNLPPAAPKGNYTDARLQIRIPNANPLTQTFSADSKLQQVFDFLVNEKGVAGSFTLGTTFPRKTFGPDDQTKTLKELNLVPSCALILQYK